MKTIYESDSTPAADGFSMPAEFAPQERVWMGWPHRTDTWAHGAKPAQRQYAAIARAISTHPPVIMADEPTGALDSRTGQQVLKFLQQLNREGSTIILITHDNGIAATAPRMVRLSDGKVISDQRQEVDWQ